MRHLIGAFGLLLLGFSAAFAGPPGRHDRGDEVKRVKRAAEVLTEIMNAPDNNIPAQLLVKAECVGIVPGLSKGGIAVGGDYGKGVVMCRRGEKDWAGPAFITIGGGSFGFQLGFEKVDLVALIMNHHGMEQLLQDKFTIGSDASAAAGPVGRTASAETDIKMDAEILTYSRSKGLFGGVALNGAVVKPDREGNRAFYGKDKDVDAREILQGDFPMPPDAAPLKAALTRAAAAAKN
jgi:lipid-binding SYLF domain-containing protein